MGETRVVDAHTGALVRVDELFARRPAGFETLSLDETTGKMVARRVTDVMQNGVKPVFTVTTAQGKKVTATGNHPFLTKTGWKWLEELRQGEEIATPRALPLARGASWPRHQLVVLAGMLSGAASRVDGAWEIRLGSEALAEDFEHAARCFRHTAVTEVRGSRIRIQAPQPFLASGGAAPQLRPAGDCELGTWAKALGVLCHESTPQPSAQEARGATAAASLPAELFTLRDGDLELFLGRLWSASGTLSSTPLLAVANEGLARDLQHLLSRLGIVAAVRQGRARETSSRGAEGGADKKRSVSARSAGEELGPASAGPSSSPALAGWKVKLLGGDAVEAFHHRVGPHLVGREEERRAMAEQILARKRTKRPEDEIHWDEIVSIEPAGEAITYDLTVDETHNFVADGVIVHNSHSAAYALITMQTAWLKCHHRAEFMAALLTSDADKTEKLVAHIADSRDRDLEVLPPDINESARSFNGRGKQIRFGLGGVKGVGETAIDSILEARQRKGEDGPFFGLYDFCERVDLRRVNRKVIECLVRCGAFDFTAIPRWRLFGSIERALERGQSTQRDRASGQSSLFGLLAGPAKAEEKTPGGDGDYPESDPWTDKEKLAGERETLGFYITGHPLDQYADEIRRVATHTTARVLSSARNGDSVKVVGVVSALRSRPTKTGKLMGFATIEDLTGTVEVICFAGGRRPGPPGPGRPAARTGGFEVWQPLLETDQPLLVSGTVQLNTRDEENPIAELIADDITPLAEVRARHASRFTLTLDADQASADKLQRARALLGQHPGPLTVELHIRIPDRSTTRVVVRDLKVAPTDELGERLNLLFGARVVGVGA
nr:OB-fold nucleic acid binding domain-containing protein [Vulgatibacter incomptus]